MKLKPAILVIGTAVVVMWMAFISILLVRTIHRVEAIERTVVGIEGTVVSIGSDTGDISDIKNTVDDIKSSTDTIETWVNAQLSW